MTVIIGFSGKKQSGKNTACNFIIGHTMNSLGLVRGVFRITKEGQLWISDLFGDPEYEGVFDVSRNSNAVKSFLAEHLNPYIKLYSYADVLKQDVCMKVLGLTYEQCYGTDEQKKSPTHLKWEDMPGVITQPLEPEWASLSGEEIMGRLGKYYGKLTNTVFHAPGVMTGRDVMQFVGTEIFRRMYGNVWVDATVRRIKDDNPAIALLSDVRFPNEVYGLQNEEGIVVRLTRNRHSEDQHESEVALDEDRFDWKDFNLIIDNEKMSIEEQNKSVYSLIVSMGLIEEKLS
jgi:hypothetical protein